MKNLFFLLFMTLLSCKSQNKINNNITILNKNDLSAFEINIVNDFLNEELKKDRYKYKNNYKLVVIDKAIKKQNSISTYEFNYKYRESWGKFIEEWILDSLQIDGLKKELEVEEVYQWKESDFTNFKVDLLKLEDLRKSTNTGEFLRRKLIINLSRPLIIDKKNAFISFDIGSGDIGYEQLTHFTVLMRKVNNKWEQKFYYYDGAF